jgi:hypothetical protein
MTLAQDDFDADSAQTWPGGNMDDVGEGCPEGGGCGAQHGYVQFGAGGFGTPPGSNGQYPSQVPQDGAGGNGGNAGDALGGAIYSSTPFVDSGSTFENNQVRCVGCGSAAAYPTGNLNNGNPAGALGSFGEAVDPDVHGSEICPAGAGANDARSDGAASSSTGGTCKLFTATVYDASDAYRPLSDYSGHAYMIRVQFKSTQNKPIPKLTVTIPGVQADWGWGLSSAGNYACDAPGGTLTCQSPSGGAASGYILAYVLSSPLGKVATTSALGSSVSNSIGSFPVDLGKGFWKDWALHSAVSDYDNSIDAVRLFLSPVLALAGLYISPVSSEAAANFRARVIQSDPPDANTGQVALPVAWRAPRQRGSCAKVKRSLRARCQRLQNALVPYTAAELDLASIEQATATTLNRFNTAERQSDRAHAALQDYAMSTLAVEADSAIAKVNSASRTVAADVAAIGYHDLTAQQVAQTAKQIQTGRLPKAVLRQLAAWGISRTAFVNLMKKPPPGFKPTKLDPDKGLRTALPAVQAGSYDVGGVAWLIEGLHAAGSLSSAQYAKLAGDAKAYATNPSAATAAALKRDCLALPGAAGQFMAIAASSL